LSSSSAGIAQTGNCSRVGKPAASPKDLDLFESGLLIWMDCEQRFPMNNGKISRLHTRKSHLHSADKATRAVGRTASAGRLARCRAARTATALGSLFLL
jgi:hypothetical protein